MTLKWECDFKRQLNEDANCRDFVRNLDIKEPLCPRDAFFGGRTNAAVLYYEAKPGELIEYADINRHVKYG